jgi:hypothetical protein
MVRILWPAGLVARTAELDAFGSALGAVVMRTAKTLQHAGPKPLVASNTIAINDGLDVVGNRCRCDAPFSGTHHTTRLGA